MVGLVSHLAVYLIDFSSAWHQEDVENQRSQVEGSLAFCSIDSHRGIGRRPKDDMESLAYTLIYLAKGELPWISAAGEFSDPETVYQKKQSTSVADICRGLPTPFKDFLSFTRALTINTPSYAQYRQLFRQLYYDD